jgi:hypothetical protein
LACLGLKLPRNCSCSETSLGQRNLLAKQVVCLGLNLRGNFSCTKCACLGLKVPGNCSCSENHLGQRSCLQKQVACLGLKPRGNLSCAESLACLGLKLKQLLLRNPSGANEPACKAGGLPWFETALKPFHVRLDSLSREARSTGRGHLSTLYWLLLE